MDINSTFIICSWTIVAFKYKPWILDLKSKKYKQARYNGMIMVFSSENQQM